jgi:hypothetical protein
MQTPCRDRRPLFLKTIPAEGCISGAPNVADPRLPMRGLRLSSYKSLISDVIVTVARYRHADARSFNEHDPTHRSDARMAAPGGAGAAFAVQGRPLPLPAGELPTCNLSLRLQPRGGPPRTHGRRNVGAAGATTVRGTISVSACRPKGRRLRYSMSAWQPRNTDSAASPKRLAVVLYINGIYLVNQFAFEHLLDLYFSATGKFT